MAVSFRVLEVAGCSQLTDSGFNSLAKHCHELEKMDAEDCSLITDNTLSHLAAGCPELMELVLSLNPALPRSVHSDVNHLANTDVFVKLLCRACLTAS